VFKLVLRVRVMKDLDAFGLLSFFRWQEL
jgi:hypothetical protein